jgi:hypothetical protein
VYGWIEESGRTEAVKRDGHGVQRGLLWIEAAESDRQRARKSEMPRVTFALQKLSSGRTSHLAPQPLTPAHQATSPPQDRSFI